MGTNTLRQPTPQSLAGLGIARIALPSARRAWNERWGMVARGVGNGERNAKRGKPTESIWKRCLIIMVSVSLLMVFLLFDYVDGGGMLYWNALPNAIPVDANRIWVAVSFFISGRFG